MYDYGGGAVKPCGGHRHAPLLEALREQLAGSPGWKAGGRARRGTVEVAGAGRGWVELGTVGAVPVILVELPPGASFPRRADRRALLSETRAPRREAIVLLCDASGSRRLWCWEERATRWGRAYREKAAEPRARGLPGEIMASIPLPKVTDPLPEIAAKLARRLGLGPGGQEELPPVLDWLEEGELAAVRRALRALRSLRLRDPDCGDGGWLLAAGRALAPLYTTAVERLSAHGAGGAAERTTGRRVTDGEALRRAVEGAFPGGAAEYVRHTILLYNLEGLARDPLEGEVARARLAGWVLNGEGCARARAVPELAGRLITLPPGGGEAEGDFDGRDLSRALPAAALAARLEELAAAYRLLRDLQLSGTAEAESLLAAHASLLRRRLELLCPGPVRKPGAADTHAREAAEVLFPRPPSHHLLITR